MISFSPSTRLSHILCLGAHCDDIEIGCGGSMLRLLAEHPQAQVRWVVFGGADIARASEAKAAAEAVMGTGLHRQIIIHPFRDSHFPSQRQPIKEEFEDIKKAFTPDLIFTHSAQDAHQDHRLFQELTWNTFRDHCILEYEIPKYDGDLWRTNTYLPLDEATVQKKIKILMDYFPSQKRRSWFTPDTFRATLRLRGIECNAPAGWAEGFQSRKIVL
jgi:LmbE family N-acetylglucosaminyl deacetylase